MNCNTACHSARPQWVTMQLPYESCRTEAGVATHRSGHMDTELSARPAGFACSASRQRSGACKIAWRRRRESPPLASASCCPTRAPACCSAAVRQSTGIGASRSARSCSITKNAKQEDSPRSRIPSLQLHTNPRCAWPSWRPRGRPHLMTLRPARRRHSQRRPAAPALPAALQSPTPAQPPAGQPTS